MFTDSYQHHCQLARIRCLVDCIDCIQHTKPLPASLCYVASQLPYKGHNYGKDGKLAIYSEPTTRSQLLTTIEFNNCQDTIYLRGDEWRTSEGTWRKVIQHENTKQLLHNKQEGWILAVPTNNDDRNSTNSKAVDALMLTLDLEALTKTCKGDKAIARIKQKGWEIAVENTYSLRVLYSSVLPPPNDDMVQLLSNPPENWSLAHDESLAKFLSRNTDEGTVKHVDLKRYVESINTSSREDCIDPLTDGVQTTYWESDGSQGHHWIRLNMKKGVVIKRLLITVDPTDDNYMPQLVVVKGGDINNLRKINDVAIDCVTVSDVVVLQDMTESFSVIEINIKECRDEGIDTRIHGIKIVSANDVSNFLIVDLFNSKKTERYPLLSTFSPEVLYNRSVIISRFIELFDSIINLVFPKWSEDCTDICEFKTIRQILVLSKRRSTLIDKLLSESQRTPEGMPKVYLDRQLASDHRSDPSQDPTASNSLFNQLYNELKPDNCKIRIDYRWPLFFEQWWECKFISEGIIDQGGGFRDSLADIAAELCPSSDEVPIPLPFFIRSCNQIHDVANIHRDGYIPNPSCKLFAKYEWIGQLMGSCFRSRECLVLSLPSFVWKQLTGEIVTWKDYVTVDEAAVRLLASLETLSEEKFSSDYAVDLTYSTILSDGTAVDLIPNGSDISVKFEDRMRFIKLVREARMHEADEQIEYIRRGLTRSVPEAVLYLLTWQELEKKVCGDPEISVQDFKNIARYEDLTEEDFRVVHFWQAVENFSNEDRSRLLRFVTGRRRLPAPFFICRSKSSVANDSLPESATCSSTLFLPEYSSAKVTEEKLLYAAFNCTSIDTDVSLAE